MDETDPLALAQYQLRNEMKLVWRYGRQEAPEQFGGCYWDNEPPVTIVALFTAEVDRHRTVLHGRLTHPDRLVIRATRQTWQQVEADNRQVADTLMPRTGLGVHGVGIGLHQDRFIICVRIEPYTVELAARIGALVSPREVLVQQDGPYRIPWLCHARASSSQPPSERQQSESRTPAGRQHAGVPLRPVGPLSWPLQLSLTPIST